MARHPERDKLRKQAISITLDGNDIAFIDQGIRHRMFQSRSHAVAWALQLLRQHVAHIMRLQQEEARRLEDLARKGVKVVQYSHRQGRCHPAIIPTIPLVDFYE